MPTATTIADPDAELIRDCETSIALDARQEDDACDDAKYHRIVAKQLPVPRRISSTRAHTLPDIQAKARALLAFERSEPAEIEGLDGRLFSSIVADLAA